MTQMLQPMGGTQNYVSFLFRINMTGVMFRFYSMIFEFLLCLNVQHFLQLTSLP